MHRSLFYSSRSLNFYYKFNHKCNFSTFKSCNLNVNGNNQKLLDVDKNDKQALFVFTGNARIDSSLDKFIKKSFELMGIYEEMIGLKELKSAQNSVILAENKFIEVQEQRRSLSTNLLNVQMKLKQLRDQMDRLNRSDPLYLKLFTQEHENLNEEKLLVHEYQQKEARERDLFFQLSQSLRDSQEKERARAERIKYLQLALSLACTFLGIIGAFLVSFLRKSELKDIVDHEKKLISDVDNFFKKLDQEQHEFNEKMQDLFKSNKIPGGDEQKLEDFLVKQENIFKENYTRLQNIIANGHHVNDNSKIPELVSSKLNEQKLMLRIISVSSVICTIMLSVLCYSKS